MKPEPKESLGSPPKAADGSVTPEGVCPSLGLGISCVEQELEQEHPSTSIRAALTAQEGKNLEAWEYSTL